MPSDAADRRFASPAPPDGSAAQAWMALAERILMLAKQFRQRLAVSAKTAALTEADLLALWASAAATPAAMNQRELADRLAVSPAQVSATVERLRQNGLLECCRDPLDRRRQVWQLTAAGHAAIATVARDVATWAKDLEADTVPAQLIDDLDRLLAQFATSPFLCEPHSPAAFGVSEVICRRGAA